MILVLLSLGAGNLDKGFESVRLQIRNTCFFSEEKFTASLPPAPKLSEVYYLWKEEYINLMSLEQTYAPRLEVITTGVTNFSDRSFKDSCKDMEQQLNNWLNTSSFAGLEKKLRTKLHTKEEILLLIETQDPILQRLPWHLWDLWQDYPLLEIGLSACEYTCVSQVYAKGSQIRILAVLGNKEGIDIESDRALLEDLTNVEIEFLVQPEPGLFKEKLWDVKGWDILFFAGHSNTENNLGYLKINSGSHGNIPVEELKFGIKEACKKGLQLAIFNSCDGIGLAANLADLNIPQTIVMREAVPDPVAQEFLKLLLPSYAQGLSLTQALRQAREQLHNLEPKYLCASWLPVLYQNPSSTQKKWDQLGRSLIFPHQKPYLGLLTFTEKEAIFFKGREALTEQLYRSVMNKPLTAVVGASGSGKSSLVFAGLLPRLRQQNGWHIIDFRPGKNPVYSLINALADFVATANLSVEDFKAKDNLLYEQLNEVLKKQTDKKILLIINQFEEIYSICDDVKSGECFLKQLLVALDKLPNFKIVLTLRADFIGDAIAFRPLAEALQFADLKIGPMNRQELKEAIVAPAELMGVSFEEGLVERILNDIADEPSNLALLEFTLTQLWEQRQEQKLTHEAYEKLGGLAKCLSLYAGKIFNEFNTAEKQVARQIFLALVRVNEDSVHNRRQVSKSDLLNSSVLCEPVLNELANHKLVVISTLEVKNSSKVVVDLAHEALITHWDLLHDWVDENTDALRFAQRLEVDARHWIETGRPKSPEFLLKGRKLRNASDFVANFGKQISLSAEVREYINVSNQHNKTAKIIKWSSITGFGVMLSAGLFLLGFSRYHKYWIGTIQRVQTVDFNILSHLLPYKLSEAMLKSDTQEIIRIINSNYGLFGIVVTDCQEQTPECHEQQILYASKSKKEWKKQLTTEDLINHPYDILRDPPPFATEHKYQSPRKLDRNPTGQVNQGKIIGRVYYIRNSPPSFIQSLFHSLF